MQPSQPDRRSTAPHDLAACFFNAFLVAGQTCLVGFVALHAGNDQYGRLVNTVGLSRFYRCDCTALSCILVAGADKCYLLIRSKVVSNAITTLSVLATSVDAESDCSGASTSASILGLPSEVSIMLTCSS